MVNDFDGVKLDSAIPGGNQTLHELPESGSELHLVPPIPDSSNAFFTNSSPILAIQLSKHPFCTLIGYI